MFYSLPRKIQLAASTSNWSIESTQSILLLFDHIKHLNTQTLMRLWSLSAPSSYILSDKGVLLAIAEQVERHPMEIHPEIDLRNYGLDQSAVNYLVDLWRANGASLSAEELMQAPILQHIMQLLKH